MIVVSVVPGGFVVYGLARFQFMWLMPSSFLLAARRRLHKDAHYAALAYRGRLLRGVGAKPGDLTNGQFIVSLVVHDVIALAENAVGGVMETCAVQRHLGDDPAEAAELAGSTQTSQTAAPPTAAALRDILLALRRRASALRTNWGHAMSDTCPSVPVGRLAPALDMLLRVQETGGEDVGMYDEALADLRTELACYYELLAFDDHLLRRSMESQPPGARLLLELPSQAERVAIVRQRALFLSLMHEGAWQQRAAAAAAAADIRPDYDFSVDPEGWDALLQRWLRVSAPIETLDVTDPAASAKPAAASHPAYPSAAAVSGVCLAALEHAALCMTKTPP